MGKALLLTVGTGNLEDVEGSLLRPLRKSIESGEWARIVLLPSSRTLGWSERLAEEMGGGSLEIRPLPEADLENDADACFRHFEAEIERLRRDGFAQQDIVVDFTRGTKAMSAALVLAAVAHDLPRLRYITGKRDSRGMVTGGTEELRETSPAHALAVRRLEAARSLVGGYSFGAALAILPDPDSPFSALQLALLRHDLAALRRLVRFLAAWDSLNYREAREIGCPDPGELPAAWQSLCPNRQTVAWVRRLAARPSAEDHGALAAWLRPLALDLLANAQRRRQLRHFEDALVRSYRVLELIGQARLFDRGIDSERVPPDHEAVVRTRQRLRKSGSADFGQGREGKLTAGRETAARLLKELGDPLARELLSFANRGGTLKTRNRNLSILNHGFEARAPSDAAEWDELFDGLWTLLEKDWPGEAAAFAAARAQARFPSG